MFDSYFFVPANQKKMIYKSLKIESINHLIFDLEDSIHKHEIDKSLKNLESIKNKHNKWIRIPSSKEKFEVIKHVINLGFFRFVIPKFKGFEDLDIIINKINTISCKRVECILLIENPKSLIDIEKILTHHMAIIHGIGLGVHDFSTITGIKNDYNVFKDIRLDLLIKARAFKVVAIDCASMNINDRLEFKKEIANGFEIGYRAKFLIHPFQLEEIEKFPFYSYEEVEESSNIIKYFKKEIENKVAVFEYEGKVYEKSHIKKLEQILEWGEDYYGANW